MMDLVPKGFAEATGWTGHYLYNKNCFGECVRQHCNQAGT